MQEKAYSNRNFFGIYVHIPFCAHRCAYCSFYQKRPTRQELDDYTETLIKEIGIQKSIPPADTVYWGGGTPTILSPKNIWKIGQHMRVKQQLLEWSVECSPGTISIEKLRILKEIGVTRITMGVQSFDKNTMNILGRRQSQDSVFKAYDMIRSCGFDNVGIDLIFAVPGQSVDSWLGDLKIAISIAPEHISTYNLTYEGDSKLNNMRIVSNLKIQDVDEEISFFLLTDQFLRENGYIHYEVSNFCKPGYESIHNTHTWEMYEWIGYGPSASSQCLGKRFTNVPSIQLWSEGIAKGRHNRCDIYNLDEQILIQDAIIFGFRMFKGINFDDLKKRFPTFNKQRYQFFFEQLSANELAILTKDSIKLTINGMLVVDAIGREIIQI